MKKIIKKLVIILFIIINICTIFTYSNAYSNKYIEIYIPSSYETEENGKNVTIQGANMNRSSFIKYTSFDMYGVSICVANNHYTYNISDLNSETYTNDIIETFKEQGYENIKIINTSKVIINNNDAIKFEISAEIADVEFYLESYEFATENYLYAISTMTTNKEYFSLSEYKQIINSIKILDKNITTETLPQKEDNIFSEAMTKGLLSTIPFAIVTYIIYKLKEKHQSKGENETNEEKIKETTEEINQEPQKEELNPKEEQPITEPNNKKTEKNENLIENNEKNKEENKQQFGH